MEEQESDKRDRLEKEFKQDIKNRIDETAKYIKPNEMIYLVIGDRKTQFNGLKSLGFGNPVLIDREGNQIK